MTFTVILLMLHTQSVSFSESGISGGSSLSRGRGTEWGMSGTCLEVCGGAEVEVLMQSAILRDG